MKVHSKQGTKEGSCWKTGQHSIFCNLLGKKKYAYVGYLINFIGYFIDIME